MCNSRLQHSDKGDSHVEAEVVDENKGEQRVLRERVGEDVEVEDTSRSPMPRPISEVVASACSPRS